jgi:hypothetical protein
MTGDSFSASASDDWQNPQFDRPTPGTPFDDFLGLSDGRSLLFGQDNRDSMEDIPRIWIKQFPAHTDWDEEDVTGRIWVHPEDLPALIEKLEEWLRTCIRCARRDSQRRPPPYWGNLLSVIKEIDDGTQEGQE